MAFEVVFTIKDGSQSSVTKRYALSGADYAACVLQADAIRTSLQAATAGSVDKMSLQEQTQYAYVPNSQTKLSKAVIVGQNSAGKKFSFILPMPDDNNFGALGTELFDVVNQSSGQFWLDTIADNCRYSDGETGALTFVSGRRVE